MCGSGAGTGMGTILKRIKKIPRALCLEQTGFDGEEVGAQMYGMLRWIFAIMVSPESQDLGLELDLCAWTPLLDLVLQST